MQSKSLEHDTTTCLISYVTHLYNKYAIYCHICKEPELYNGLISPHDLIRKYRNGTLKLKDAEILRGALHKTPIDVLIKHIKSTPDPDFPEDADIKTRLEAYAFNDIIKLPNISAREVSLWLIAESKKEISKTSPIFIAYRGFKTYAIKITRARHHHMSGIICDPFVQKSVASFSTNASQMNGHRRASHYNDESTR